MILDLCAELRRLAVALGSSELEACAAELERVRAQGLELAKAWEGEAEAADSARPGGIGELLASQRALIWGSAAAAVEGLIAPLGGGPLAPPRSLDVGAPVEELPPPTLLHRRARRARRSAPPLAPAGAAGR